MKTCVSGKRSYPTKEVAEDALIDAQTKFEYGRTAGPIAVYQCEDCGQYHLTSKGPMNERLAKALAEGSIQRQKEANQWLDKLKRR